MRMRLAGVLVIALVLAGALDGVSMAAESPSPDAVEIELFSDFQCPYCAALAPALRALQANGVDGIPVSVTFRHFPLPMHSHAPQAHRAALAADAQGKFWEMHDLLFANRDHLEAADLLGYARRLKLDMKRFSRDIEAPSIQQRIVNDVAEGSRRNIDGTPTFYVNGTAYVGARSLVDLQTLVRNERARVRAVQSVPDALLARGPATAPVTVEFFADLQSPVTPPAFAVIQQLVAARANQVRVQFRSLPLAFHPQAPLAHEAAVTAAPGGRFWDFVTYFLEHQDSWREQDLPAVAKQLGLDEAVFSAALARHEYAPRVTADVQEATRRGIRGSPVVIVNGTRIDGVPSLQQLLALVDAVSPVANAVPAESQQAQTP